jgi:spore maturation protein CgeB
VGVNTFPNSYGYVSNRIFQALHSGNFTLQQKIPGMTETIGLEDGKHLVEWTDLKDLEEKIKYWLPRMAERNQIAREGKKFVDRYHTFDQRVVELESMLEKLKTPVGSH